MLNYHRKSYFIWKSGESGEMYLKAAYGFVFLPGVLLFRRKLVRPGAS